MAPIPNMDSTLSGWGEPFQYAVIRKAATDFQVTESKTDVEWADGVLLPIPPRKLVMKPEGERNWKWWTLYSAQQLSNDWIVKDLEGKEFRVVSTSDWKAAGYFEYEIVETPV